MVFSASPNLVLSWPLQHSLRPASARPPCRQMPFSTSLPEYPASHCFYLWVPTVSCPQQSLNKCVRATHVPTFLRVNPMPWQWLEAPSCSPAPPPICSHPSPPCPCSSHTGLLFLPRDPCHPFTYLASAQIPSDHGALTTPPPHLSSPSVLRCSVFFMVLITGEDPGFEGLRLVQFSKPSLRSRPTNYN